MACVGIRRAKGGLKRKNDERRRRDRYVSLSRMEHGMARERQGRAESRAESRAGHGDSIIKPNGT